MFSFPVVVIAILTVQKRKEIEATAAGSLPTFDMETTYELTEKRMNSWCSPQVLNKIDKYLTQYRTMAGRNRAKRIKRCPREGTLDKEPERKRTKISERVNKAKDVVPVVPSIGGDNRQNKRRRGETAASADANLTNLAATTEPEPGPGENIITGPSVVVRTVTSRVWSQGELS
jgi:hypothetical protein